MASAGALKDKLSFQRREADANGDLLGPWAEVFTRNAEITWLKGSEPVMAQRLQGVQPVVITIREDSSTRQVASGWRAVGAYGLIAGKVFDLTAPLARSKTAGFMDILATAGGSDGVG